MDAFSTSMNEAYFPIKFVNLYLVIKTRVF
jgi:hypothetical protein